MTITLTTTGAKKLKINKLTKTQLENATLSNTEVYFVDPEFTGGKLLSTTNNGDIVESSINPDDVGTVKDVQVNGNTIVSSGIATIPIASSNLGLVKVSGDGLGIDGSTGQVYLDGVATSTELTNKTATTKYVSPTNIDDAVKVGLTTNTNTLSTSEKQTATDWILPSQTGNSGKFLITDGTNASWANETKVIIREWS